MTITKSQRVQLLSRWPYNVAQFESLLSSAGKSL